LQKQCDIASLFEFVLPKRSDIASLCRVHQDTKECENGDDLTEQNRFVEFAWESAT
jgi:phosphoenolpyruvate carboxylase